MIAALLLLVAGLAAAEPSDATLVYYNARMALREERPLETTKLWLLRNALLQQTDRVSPYDADFHSVIWAATGAAGICQDGLRSDEDAAGLWPLAFHNWVVANRNRRAPPKSRRVFDAFEVGRQQRRIAIGDVLSVEELKTVHFRRGHCVRPRATLLLTGEPFSARLTDRQVAGRLMLHLLQRSQTSLDPNAVRGESAVEARIFDLELQLASLAEREAKRDQRGLARLARQVGLGRASVDALKADAPGTTLDPASPPAQILRDTLGWTAQDWMALSDDRRRFLFDRSLVFNGPSPELDAAALGVVDALIAQKRGAEVEQWIARCSGDPIREALLWRGERGRRLLALSPDDGFGERSVIALRRGVEALQGGDLSGALRVFAFALQTAPESRSGQAVASLSLRWLTHVASQVEITDELLITLQELVPRREYSILLEDLMWSAALHADERSFALGERNQRGRGALQRRLQLLRPLAQGKVGPFVTSVRAGLSDSPSETMAFIDQLVQRVELEDADVRAGLLPVLHSLRALLQPLAEDIDTGRFARRAQATLDRTQAITDGLEELADDARFRDRAHAIAPGSELFAGSVRLAPIDPIPWPFAVEEATAPSVFEPLVLTPVEWRDADGAWVYGWEIHG